MEPRYAQHKGQCLDELLVQLLMHGRALELDAAIDKCSKTPGSSPGLSPSSSMEELLPGSEAMAAAEGLLAGHVFPVYPGPAAGGLDSVWGDQLLFAAIISRVQGMFVQHSIASDELAKDRCMLIF